VKQPHLAFSEAWWESGQLVLQALLLCHQSLLFREQLLLRKSSRSGGYA
jgi:hypothetical protein